MYCQRRRAGFRVSAKKSPVGWMVRWPGWAWEMARKERKLVERRGFEGEEEESLLPLW